uniref:Uncharacterized protein n=1 Tax=Anguilla anguilla TaxID=7936 RepID=A0A0E9SC00_ANGAN
MKDEMYSRKSPSVVKVLHRSALICRNLKWQTLQIRR